MTLKSWEVFMGKRKGASCGSTQGTVHARKSSSTKHGNHPKGAGGMSAYPKKKI